MASNADIAQKDHLWMGTNVFICTVTGGNWAAER